MFLSNLHVFRPVFNFGVFFASRPILVGESEQRCGSRFPAANASRLGMHTREEEEEAIGSADQQANTF